MAASPQSSDPDAAPLVTACLLSTGAPLAQFPAALAASPPSHQPNPGPPPAGFKCNSAVWRALRSVNDRHEAWLEDGKSASGSPKV